MAYLFFPLTVAYMELIFRAFHIHAWSVSAVVISIAFSLALGLALAFLCTLGGRKYARACGAVLLGLLTLYFGVHAVFNTIFQQYLGVGLVGGGGNALSDFWYQALLGIAASLPVIFLLLIPFVLWLVFSRRFLPEKRNLRLGALFLALSLVLALGTDAAVKSSKKGAVSLSFLYTKGFVLESGIVNFGLIPAQCIEISKLLHPQSIAPAAPLPTTPAVETPAPSAASDAVYDANIMDIDFAALAAGEENAEIAAMHSYFAARTPTMKNEYTGLFAGKNLIWICAEAFSPWALDAGRTPTLVEMASNGFVFENFYCPLTGASTTGGEFMTLTGLYQATGRILLSDSSADLMPFCAGNALGAMGYTCQAYHNGSYGFYNRNVSHPNLGYPFAVTGYGIDVAPGERADSDTYMMTASLPKFADNTPFHTYYMSISGHMPYSSANHWCTHYAEYVEELPFTPAAKAYCACQMELDRALEALISGLDERGILDDTVFVMSPDHYPYGLERGDIESIAGKELTGRFDLEKSTLILWCPGMEETVNVKKPCSSADILPTLLNLFGVEYDSRLIMGRDILSASPGFVPFMDYSFISELGEYDAHSGVFTPAGDAVIPEDYVTDTVSEIQRIYGYSHEIIFSDYYGAVFGA